MLTKLQYTFVRFSTRLSPAEVPAFRGALGWLAGDTYPLIHNHMENDQLRWSYPLIQYRSIDNQAAIVALNEGADEIFSLLNDDALEIDIQGRLVALRVESVRLRTYPLVVWNRPLDYRLHSWLPLKNETEEDYRRALHESSLPTFFARKLTGNMLSYAKGVGWHVDKPIQTVVGRVSSPIKRRFKGIDFLSFDLTFSTNLFLPPYIGLGKSAALGFGSVLPLRQPKLEHIES